jgi:hypothetical protein
MSTRIQKKYCMCIQTFYVLTQFFEICFYMEHRCFPLNSSIGASKFFFTHDTKNIIFPKNCIRIYNIQIYMQFIFLSF